MSDEPGGRTGHSSSLVPRASNLRLVAWNIRAGGGKRSAAIAEALLGWEPDIVALSEYRATPPSLAIGRALADAGLEHQLTTASPATPGVNALLLASRWPLSRLRQRRVPAEKWLAARVASPEPLAVAAIHIPNEVTGRKWPWLEAMLATVRTWRAGPGIILGDTNSGWPALDEENPVFGPRYAAWFDAIEAAGWADAFRELHGGRREYTWYSPNGGNGFRIDQAFVPRRMLPRVRAVQHCWPPDPAQPGRRDALSDHAALVVDLAATVNGKDPVG